MIDLYSLFTKQKYQSQLLVRGFPKEYTNVGPVNNRVSKRTEAGEMPSIGGDRRPTER